MYGFQITVTLGGGGPDSLSSKLDEITDELARASYDNDAFMGYMVVEKDDYEATFLITASAENEAMGLAAATSWLHTAVHAVGFATPGWLRRAEQVFDDAPGFDDTPVSC